MNKKVILLFCTVLSFQFSFGQVKNPEATTDKFNMLLNYVEHLYVDSVDAAELTERAVVALLEQLDPHSSYFTAEEMQESNEPLQGSFSGIGISFNILKDTIYVLEPISGGPSERLGIKAGDKIIEVDGELVAGIGIKNSGVASRLKGPKGTKVKVGIQRKGVKDLIPYEITRDNIPIYSVDAAYMVAPEVGYIKVARFAKNTMEELKAGIIKLKGQGMTSLVLDLQGNGGGYLNTAVEMADEFISGDKLLVYTEGKAFPRKDDKANPKLTGLFEKGKLIILIDESTASASEIVSGAVQDWDRGLIIGRRSFGKGLVQRQFNFGDGSSIRLTVQRYYTPSGRSIQKPYDDGLEAYFRDKETRYKKGEYFTMDSIQMPDSLKYYTNIKKRLVYGGGGILPDIFVPLDTTDNSDYFADLIRTGVNNEWALTFTDKNREALLAKYPTSEKFVSEFELSAEDIKDMIAMAEKEKVAFVEEDFKRSEETIKIRTKALIARNLYDNEAFYRVINHLNPALKKALDTLNDGTFDAMNLGDETDIAKTNKKPNQKQKNK
jgi:carboxyl-terminal processing protease